jgi:predicted transcriptional regulator YheO
MKMSKPALIRKITNTIRKMPKKRLAVLCYNITKSKLPRLKTIRRKAIAISSFAPLPYERYSKASDKRRKKKRKKMTKAEKTKFLARLNKGRIKAGLKPIRAKR